MANVVLIVEDEENIRKFTKINLEREGFTVLEAESGEKGVELALEFRPDVAILDLMLPGIDGYEVCQILREKAPQIGVIMLTAKTQEEDKIRGLEKGADDYMSKPFNPKELALRLKSLIRRLDKPELNKKRDLIVDDPFKIDTYSRTFYKNDQEVDLTPTELSLATLFMKNPGKCFSRNELLDMTWGTDYRGADKIVDVNIRRLRAKIEDDPGNPKYIETVWGVGYRWNKD